MTAVWITIAGLALATAAIKIAGPVALGGRELPPEVLDVISLLAPALLAALVLTKTFSTSQGNLTLDTRAVGAPPPRARCFCARLCWSRSAAATADARALA